MDGVDLVGDEHGELMLRFGAYVEGLARCHVGSRCSFSTVIVVTPIAAKIMLVTSIVVLIGQICFIGGPLLATIIITKK